MSSDGEAYESKLALSWKGYEIDEWNRANLTKTFPLDNLLSHPRSAKSSFKGYQSARLD